MRNLIILFTLLYSLSLSAITIYVPKAPPAIALLKMAEKDSTVEIKLYTDFLTQVLPRIIKKDDALYVIPTNMAAKLYNKKRKIELIGVTSTGLLSIVSKDITAKTISKLHKKSVYIGAPGSSPDIIARYIFKKLKITPRILYSSSSEIAKLFQTGKVKHAVLPEPLSSFVIHNNAKLKRISFKNIWKKLHPSSNGIPQVSLVGSSSFIAKNRKKLKNLLKAFEKSVEWVNKNRDKAADYALKKLNYKQSSDTLSAAIKHMNLLFTPSAKAKKEVLFYLKQLYSVEPESIGGKLPGNAFFMEN